MTLGKRRDLVEIVADIPFCLWPPSTLVQQVALAAAQYYSVRWFCFDADYFGSADSACYPLQRNRKFAEALHVVPLPPGLVPLPDTQFESLGRHVPSLTARQGRRNGISEKELRARWGA